MTNKSDKSSAQNPTSNGIDIKALASLARLRVSDDELASLKAEIPAILAFIEQVKETGAKFEKKPGVHRNIMREDTESHESGEYSEDLLGALPERSENYAQVRQVIKKML